MISERGAVLVLSPFLLFGWRRTTRRLGATRSLVYFVALIETDERVAEISRRAVSLHDVSIRFEQGW